MPPTVLNYYQNYPGIWQPPQSDLVELGIDQQIVPPGATVRLYETARSGFVTLWPVGGGLTVAGDLEVFVRIDFANNTYTYLSAPLTTPVDFANVSNVRLGIVAPVGPVGTSGPITEVGYRIVANAHLIYEVL
jgi:hypothetical protein